MLDTIFDADVLHTPRIAIKRGDVVNLRATTSTTVILVRTFSERLAG